MKVVAPSLCLIQLESCLGSIGTVSHTNIPTKSFLTHRVSYIMKSIVHWPRLPDGQEIVCCFMVGSTTSCKSLINDISGSEEVVRVIKLEIKEMRIQIGQAVKLHEVI